MRLEVVGFELRAYIDGVLKLTIEDTDVANQLSSGDPGLYYAGSSASFNAKPTDAWSAGDVSDSALVQVTTPNAPGRAFHFERNDGAVMLLVENQGVYRAFQVGAKEWSE